MSYSSGAFTQCLERVAETSNVADGRLTSLFNKNNISETSFHRRLHRLAQGMGVMCAPQRMAANVSPESRFNSELVPHYTKKEKKYEKKKLVEKHKERS